MGGIRTNLDAETNIPGLFVCGEAASTGVMGANRLASNSLLECLVFGKRAGDKARKRQVAVDKIPDVEPISMKAENEEVFLKYRNEMVSLMSENLGIVRNKKDIEKALDRFDKIEKKFANFDQEYNLFKIRNTACVCKIIARGALAREESRGGHIREDFQKERRNFKLHSIQQKGEKLQFEPVRV